MEKAIKNHQDQQCGFWNEHAENAIEEIKTVIAKYGVGSPEHKEASDVYKAIADLALA